MKHSEKIERNETRTAYDRKMAIKHPTKEGRAEHARMAKAGAALSRALKSQ